MKKLIAATSVLSLLFLFSGTSFSETKHHGHYSKGMDGHKYMGHGKHGSKWGGWCLLKYKTELGLTEEQQAKIKALKTENQKQAIMRQADIDVAKVELKELIHKSGVDKEAVKAKIKEVYGKKADKRIARYLHKQDVKSVLTPEQKEKLKKIYTMAKSKAPKKSCPL